MNYEKWSVEKIDTHLGFHVSQMMNYYIKTQKDWLTIIYLLKKAPYLNPNESKVNQQIKSNICANRFYDHIEEQKSWHLEDGMTTLDMTLDLYLHVGMSGMMCILPISEYIMI
jgi:hypothetical protein